MPRDEVIAQDPEAGEQVKEGSSVTVFISGGRGEVPVPAVEGLSQGDAEKAIRDADLKVKVRKAFSDSVPEGEVVSSSPAARTSR